MTPTSEPSGSGMHVDWWGGVGLGTSKQAGVESVGVMLMETSCGLCLVGLTGRRGEEAWGWIRFGDGDII